MSEIKAHVLSSAKEPAIWQDKPMGQRLDKNSEQQDTKLEKVFGF